MPHVETVWTVVVGGGNGQRFGKQKQYELIGDRRVIDHSKAVAEQMSDGVVVVVPASDAVAERAIAGGNSRSASVRAGLAAVPDDATIVCVHDAARPLASPAVYERVIAAVAAGADAAVPGIPVADTIKVVEANGTVVATPDRSTLVAVQTPQAFRASVLRAAHAGGGDATDDAALIEQAGGTVVVVEGDHLNRKITLPDDLEWARREMGER
ncbi:2-C-methyl-D-erythritol 4-phosphate cytidylyltransferase [uncultured Ilumatobacter sp.]|uniref:2-C-methyl-D-erythritol 4-phosphate cytidylyltransferase n=1 Tax=uncultured Ilumatobacter sp. TaxID=879968 RepID=UPI00374F3B0F